MHISLKDLSLAELWQLFPIVLKPHNPAYSEWYAEEEKELYALLDQEHVINIHHVGSTAVVGLIAKPTVDILLEMPVQYNLDAVSNLLEDNGWLVMSRNDDKQTIDLNKGYTPEGFAEKVFHLHIKPQGNRDEVYFRDYLRNHPAVAKTYEQLKLSLKEQFEHDRDAYTNAKTTFIEHYTQLAKTESGYHYHIGQPELYARLSELQIAFEYHEHPPTPTVEEARLYWNDPTCTYCKNLFFRNHKGNRHYLVVLEHNAIFNIHDLEQQLHQGKLSFASGERMHKYLGLQPGSVSPFGLINDATHHVHVFFDRALKDAAKLAFHPNDNRVSLILSATDFWRYMDASGNTYEFI